MRTRRIAEVRVTTSSRVESGLSSILAGIHGSSLKERRKPMSAMIAPKKVESPGSGSGWQNGSARMMSSNV